MSQDQDPTNPPPENEYAAEGYGASENVEYEEAPSVKQSAPAVAAPQNRVVILFGVVIVVVIMLSIILFSGGDKKAEKKAEEGPPQQTSVAAPVETPAPLPVPAAPPEPTTPEPEATQLPAPPLPPQENATDVGVPEIQENPADIAAREKAEEDLRVKRLRSNMLVAGGKVAGMGGSNAQISSDERKNNPKDANLQYANSQTDKVESVQAERLGNLPGMIAQGKMVEVVLESAINTDLPAPIRAIVSRDIYAESGHEVLIPKGSRVIGRYNTDILRGQRRIFIIWSRVIRPDGVSIMISSPGVDQIGRGGVEGVVDNKYLEVYSAAILTSLVTIGAAVGADAAVGGQVTTTTNSLGGSSTTGDTGAMAVQQAVQDLGQTTSTVVNRAIETRPTITLDQGTRLNIFVNHDLTFPASVLRTGGSVLID